MSDPELVVELRGQTAMVKLNRPERRNSLSASLLVSLADCFSQLEEDGKARCIVLRGAGEKAFCAGMDLTSVPSSTPEELVLQIASRGPLQAAVEAMENCRLPVIGMIRGYALGAGCELAMGCDLRVGSEDCRMGMPPARLGIVYAPEGIARFIRSIGLAQTKKLFLTARYFPGREAYEMGLLHFLVPDPELEAFTIQLANDVSKRAPLAISGIKRSLNILSQYSAPSEDEQVEIKNLIEGAASSRDAREALAAFNEKRDPEFRGE